MRRFAPTLGRLVREAGPACTSLFVGPGLRSLRGIDALSSLEELVLLSQARLDPVARLPALRALELSYVDCPDLRPIAGLRLERLVLDGVRGVRLRDLVGLRVERLDLWGCTVDTLAPLATMPDLREVWVYRPHGVGPARLAHLAHLGAGARIVLDGSFDPDAERAHLAALEARGAWIFAGDDPHGNGVHPSWWGDRAPTPDGEPEPPRYVTATG